MTRKTLPVVATNLAMLAVTIACTTGSLNSARLPQSEPEQTEARGASDREERILKHIEQGALRGAQLEMIGDRDHSPPYYWAGYTLTGDPDVGWRPPGATLAADASSMQP